MARLTGCIQIAVDNGFSLREATRMVGVMNDTKWEELRRLMFDLRPRHPQFQIKDKDRIEPRPWDGEWYYHFRDQGYDSIEYVDLRTPDPAQREQVRDCLRQVHVPGHETADGFRILGWITEGQSVGYIE
jgi:hypothetical protein